MYCKNCGKEIDDKAEICVGCGVRTINVQTEKIKSRTVELVLGLLGGIFGLIGAITAIMFGGLGQALNASGASSIVGAGVMAIIFSIIGIVGAVIVKSRNKTAGYMMLISAFGGLICISLAYVISFILLLIGGIMALRK